MCLASFQFRLLRLRLRTSDYRVRTLSLATRHLSLSSRPAAGSREGARKSRTGIRQMTDTCALPALAHGFPVQVRFLRNPERDAAGVRTLGFWAVMG